MAATGRYVCTVRWGAHSASVPASIVKVDVITDTDDRREEEVVLLLEGMAEVRRIAVLRTGYTNALAEYDKAMHGEELYASVPCSVIAGQNKVLSYPNEVQTCGDARGEDSSYW